MKLLFTLSLGLGLLFGATAWADALVANGTGNVPIRDGRRLEARDNALSAALDNALTKAAVKLVGTDSPDWSSDQTDAFEAKILPKRRDFQTGFEIIVDAPEPEGDRYKVRVSVTYDDRALKAALEESGVLKHRATTWHSIMVIIPEHHLSAPIPDPAAETQIVRVFTEAHYNVVDQSQIAAIRYNEQVSAAARGDVTAAAAIGRKFGAEIVIVGEAFSKDIGEQPNGLASVAAHVEARVIETDNARILAANDQDASAVGPASEFAAKKALGKAGTEIAKYFMAQLESRAKEDRGQPKTVQLVITDIPYKPYVQLKGLMKEKVGGIEDFHEHNYEANRAELDVEYSAGDAQTLAGALATTKLDGFKLTITKTSVNRIDMAASPAVHHIAR